jgi:HNH endonuclease
MTTPPKKVYLSTRVSVICKQCQCTFTVFPSAYKRGEGLFCSIACLKENRKQNRQPLDERFWKYVNKLEGCWLWTGAQCKGYGVINLDHILNNQEYSHRASWVLHFGAIPDRQKVLHKCDTPLCVRPDHLFLGLDIDNNRDRANKGRGNARLVHAFGETRPMYAWLEDPRCKATRIAIFYRLAKGMSPEDAITTPLCPRSERRHQFR